MLETNKQALLFNFGEDLSYFVILRYKLHDLIKIERGFSKDFVTISDWQEKFGEIYMALAAYNM